MFSGAAFSEVSFSEARDAEPAVSMGSLPVIWSALKLNQLASFDLNINQLQEYNLSINEMMNFTTRR